MHGVTLEGHALTLLRGVDIAALLQRSHAAGVAVARIHTWLGDAILRRGRSRAEAPGLVCQFVLPQHDPWHVRVQWIHLPQRPTVERLRDRYVDQLQDIHGFLPQRLKTHRGPLAFSIVRNRRCVVDRSATTMLAAGKLSRGTAFPLS